MKQYYLKLKYMLIEQRLRRLESVLNSKELLTESFKSSALRQFILELKKISMKSGNGKYIPWELSNLNWSQLSEHDVIFIKPEQALKYVSTDYIVFWGAREKKEVKYISPSYSSRSGYRNDNSIYARAGLIALTCGKKFVKLSNGKFDTLESSYDLPASGYLSYLKLRTQIADFAIVISKDVVLNSVSSKSNLIKSRSVARGGSLALQVAKGVDLAGQNISRYKSQLKKNKFNNETKETTDRVTAALTKLKSKINSISTGELISFNTETYTHEDLSREISRLDSSRIKTLEELVSLFNDISYNAYYYLYYRQRYGAEDRNTQSKLENLELLLSKNGF